MRDRDRRATTASGENSISSSMASPTTVTSPSTTRSAGACVRVIYVDERLTFLTASRRHEWFARRLAELVKAVASAAGIRWEDAGSATYRRREKEVGVEGDETFYFGAHAELMRGSVDVDLATQPPPDLAIEVEITHPADDALLVYGRLGVPEVWRFDVEDWSSPSGSGARTGRTGRGRGSACRAVGGGHPRSAPPRGRLARAMVRPAPDWARATILPRMAEG